MTGTKKRISETLLELLIGIVFYGVLCELVGVWFVKDALRYSAGLWIGILLACFSGIHMDWSLNRNFDRNGSDERAVQAYAIRSNLIRYAIILIAFLVVCLTDFLYPLAAFLGIMGLKAGAYLQPLTHKLLNRKKQRR
ncbi:MAG: ATP synthase subunit I [Lachnospiraceae bacterium]